ncbi:MAG TPA: hypothetical protein VJ208_03665 [Candidatus Nanoarchaeia archaeon]|nr:hypothetical protein [Candidatus Nanoarchaeia archaeon]
MPKEFPRKEFYAHTTERPLNCWEVVALKDREIEHSQKLKEYSEGRWETENKGWTSSPIPTTIDVESTDNGMMLHCGFTEYKYFLGMVKMAIENKNTSSLEFVHGLSTEIMPLTLDGMFFLNRRSAGATQHGVGFYDVPTAGQNAQMWIDKIPEEHNGLVRSMLDMTGFPRWNLVRYLGLRLDEITEVKYTGFSKGFEVSLDSQFNGYALLNLESEEILRRGKNAENLLAYRFDDLNEIFACIGNDGKEGRKIKEDIHGKVPEPNERGFVIVDDCYGTLLSNRRHLSANGYSEGIDVLRNRGYVIKEIPSGNIHLDDFV